MKILAFPKEANNPYQELLYGPMRNQGIQVTYLAGPTSSATLNLPTYIPQLIAYRLRGYKIFHLHWVHGLALDATPWRTAFGKSLVYIHYLLFLKVVKMLGFKLVWTAHNVLPHEQIFQDDIQARRMLLGVADLVLIHSELTIDSLKKIAVPRKIEIIPHGSYIGVYPKGISRKEARAKLTLSDAAFVYLYIGQIRSYKGVDLLIEAFNKIEHKDAFLVIAGKSNELELTKKIEDESKSNRNISLFQGVIKDADLQVYFAASDIVVLPFKKITTSGSTLLALSFGKAVVVPSMGDLEYLPDGVAYKYAPYEADGLLKKLNEVYENRTNILRKEHEAELYAEKLAWPIIAQKTVTAYKNLY